MATATDRPANPDEYNGWTNRETWAVNLYLSNDQGLDSMVRERIAEAIEIGTANYAQGPLDGVNPAPVRLYAADAIKDFVDELLEPDEGLVEEHGRASMASDMGSLWRVDWFEIADAFLEQ